MLYMGELQLDNTGLIESDVLAEEVELGNSFPEFMGNSPLENTSLVYSIPVMGEWHNGNLIRMLKAMFSQRVRETEAFEVELIANIGNHLNQLLVVDNENWRPKKDSSGKLLLSMEGQNDAQKKGLELLRESKESLLFLKKKLLMLRVLQKKF